jgi:ubiquinone/menaquinone biosynthesis C-methylase UbiE
MSERDWPASDYAIGSYIQATIADHYVSDLRINPSAKVLDIGCGNGSYTRKILDKVPQGSVLGIDASENMLQLAQEVCEDYLNFSLKKTDVLRMEFDAQFDYLVSFWCLQWANEIHKAFTNMVNALKPGGKFFTLFPAGDDPFIMGYYAHRDSGRFKALQNFEPPMNYSNLENLAKRLETIPCNNLNVQLCRESITLPSLDFFKKFVNGIAFYQGQLSESEVREVNAAMVRYFDDECQKKYGGEYQFNFTIYLVTGEK